MRFVDFGIVLKVGTRYTREQYSKTVAQSFLVRLMRLSMSSDAEVRLTVQHILHTLLHRHHNAHYLPKPTQQTSSKERLREREEGPRTLLCSQPKASRHVPTLPHSLHAHRATGSRRAARCQDSLRASPLQPQASCRTGRSQEQRCNGGCKARKQQQQQQQQEQAGAAGDPGPAAAAAAAQPQEGEEKALLAPNPPPSQDTLPTVERSDCSTEYTSRYLTDFEPVQRLARGGLGVVCQVRNKLDENEYAVKRINLPTNKSSAERVKREVRALAKLNHANIVVRCYNSWPETPPQDGRTPRTPRIASKSPAFVCVGTKYTREQYSKTVAQSFLVRLMRLSMSSDAEVRQTVQHILHTLLHRHHNAHYLPKPTSLSGSFIVSKQSSSFIFTYSSCSPNQCDRTLISGVSRARSSCCRLRRTAFANNTLANLEAVFTTPMLLLLLLLLEIPTSRHAHTLAHSLHAHARLQAADEPQGARTPSVHPSCSPRLPAGPDAARSSVAMEGARPGNSSSSSSSSRNRLEQRATQGVRTYTCDHCGKVCSTKAAIARHVLSHASKTRLRGRSGPAEHTATHTAAAAAAAAQPQEGEEKALLAPNPPPSQDTLPTVERSDCSTEYTSRYLKTDFAGVAPAGRALAQVRCEMLMNEYAVKRINLPTNKSSAERVKREVRALAKLNHANIVVRCYNSWPETPPQDGRTPKTLCIASKSPCLYDAFSVTHRER
ncbi:hypothetical protein O3P69_020296 [Scylla paramamosain]|uniref:C2H2-type domain-containing protein n=1 Tax=Scylla paramamosain TaxID=85552 RepID=A0AAW0SJ81_SCYPA